MRALAHFYRNLANTPWLLYPLLFVTGTLAAALPTLRTGTVLPQEYDEFAYQLGAETFALGRLANPPHPLAPFFETMHVLQAPTYASKYPPGQSLQLAAGILLGHPIYGVWITVGLMAVAAAWMLRGLAPATWAAAGGLIASWEWGALTYWGRTYWGGSLLALAGMLVFGGAVRFWRNPSASAAWWAGVGAGIMALTRPYEGLWFCSVPAATMGWRFYKWKMMDGSWKKKNSTAFSFFLPVAAALVFLLIYNRAVTGDALKFPHRLYQEQYEPDVSVFTWEHPGPPPAGRNPELAYQIRRFDPALMLAPTVDFFELWKSHLTVALRRIGLFFLPGLFGIGLAWAVVSGQCCRRFSGKIALANLLAFLVMLGTLRFFGFPHYAAAWSAPLAALIVLGFRGLCTFRFGAWRLPRCLLGGVMVGWALVNLFRQTASINLPYPWVLDRLDTIATLESQSDSDHRGHVVFVMMAEGQPAFAEWVYNSPNIDTQTVVFARSLGPARDVAVSKYFPTRHLWQAWLKPNGELDRLTPYDPTHPTPQPKPSPPPNQPLAPAL